MKKVVIFDLDGTLANTLESIAYCTNRALADFGLPSIPTEQFKRFVGNGARTQITRALRFAGDPEREREGGADDDGFSTSPAHLEEVFARYMEYFSADCMYRVEPYPGIRELLEELKRRSVRIAVFSNKPHANTEAVIRSLFGEGYFDAVQGQTPAIPKKPAPDGVYAILKDLGAKPDQALYVGDSWVDIETGKASGVRTVGVLWGFRDRQELEAHHADWVIGSPGELLGCLEV
ncbi:MAG: HAD family hydrolase [Eubacteriales bacterium]|nr:HAD family hydrolase [Eubacteriales bacterium]